MGTDLAGLRLHALPFPALAPNTCLEVQRQQDAPGALCSPASSQEQPGSAFTLGSVYKVASGSAFISAENRCGCQLSDPASPGTSAGLPASLKGGRPSTNPTQLQPTVPCQLRLVQAGFAHSAEGTELGTRQQQVMKQVHLHLPPGTSSLRLKTMSTEGCSRRC